MITIQGFAKLCGCNTQTLRYYDRIGLLAPAKVDEWTGYRYYEEDQAMRFVKIKNLQQADFSIEEIRPLLEENEDRLAEAFERKIEEQQQKLERIRKIQRSYLKETMDMQNMIRTITDFVEGRMGDPKLWKEFGLDDAQDEGSLRGKAGQAALKKAFAQVKAAWPDQCRAVEESLSALTDLEKAGSTDLDALSRLSGHMLGACFVWREDAFAPYLREMGDALGRFIYLMDAYEDYDADEKHHRFNPLKILHAQPDYEERMEEILTLEMSRCARAFECLPIQQDAGLIRNVLYSGVWGGYARLREKRKEKQR